MQDNTEKPAKRFDPMCVLRAIKKAPVSVFLLMVFVGSLITHQIMLDQISKYVGAKPLVDVSSVGKLLGAGKVRLGGNLTEDLPKIVMHHGVPDIYGQPLSVNYDQVQESMDIMKTFDPDSGSQRIALNEEEMKRYIEILIRISCEYCCGAKSVIFENGQSACGCAHAKAMRGLAAYLVRNHGAKFTNDEVLRELAIWKGRYFPKQMMQKLAGQIQSGNYTPDVAALVMGLKMPKYEGASANVPLPTDVENMPNMVGGC